MNTINTTNTCTFQKFLNVREDNHDDSKHDNSEHDRLNLYYTQMLNARRFDNHGVVYVFDEVGCGKTISAILAMAKTIYDKLENHESLRFQEESKDDRKNFNILVITPKSVCPQFTQEIKNRLDIKEIEKVQDFGEIHIKDISDFNSSSVNKELKSLMTEFKDNTKSHIIITNPHKVKKIQSLQIQWDLIVVDEAHDIICNNQRQAQAFKQNDITSIFDALKELNDENKLTPVISDNPDNIVRLDNSNGNIILTKTTKLNQKSETYVSISRTNTQLFYNLTLLKSYKTMFLTATPYKNSREPDFLNYAYAATNITSNNKNILVSEYVPNLDWVENLYGDNFDLNAIESSNTSMFFKEVALNIPFGIGNDAQEITTKQRFINKIEPNDLTQLPYYLKILNVKAKYNKIFKALNDDYIADDKNRALIFVSCSAEGKEVFDKLFPNSGYNILSSEKNSEKDIKAHFYTDKATNIKCEFIMNKYGNSKELKNYSDENDSIPDILIVTWQVAQTGVNLPTFNHVIHYHIPSIPGYIEQRFGRIDRMNSDKRNLHNIYCFEEGSLSHYNLAKALTQYRDTLLGDSCNLPVKNTLLCKGLNLPPYDGSPIIAWINYLVNLLNNINYSGLDDKFIEEMNTEFEALNKELTIFHNKLEPKVIQLESITKNSTRTPDSLNSGKYADEPLESLPEGATDEDKKENKENHIKGIADTIAECIQQFNKKGDLNQKIKELNGIDFNAGEIIYVTPNAPVNSSNQEDAKNYKQNHIDLNTVVTEIKNARIEALNSNQ